MLHRLTLALFATSLILFTASCARKTPTLNLLVWEGYADPSYVKAFEEQNHCKVSASYMGRATNSSPNCAAAARVTTT